MPGPSALTLTQISKTFGNVIALTGADLVVRPGTVHAVLGENGAGKTTLMRVAYGSIRPDAGTITVAGAPRRFGSSADAIRAGIGMVHQHYALVPAMTVAENVALGGHGRYDPRASAAQIRRIAGDTGLALDPEARVEALSVEAQQRVEIVKALARDARVIILDEPTAVLAPSTAADLLAWLRRFADSGHSVVLITHKLREALAIADDITVLRRGHTVLAAPRGRMSEDDLADAMLGTAGTGSRGSVVGNTSGRLGASRRDRPPGLIPATDHRLPGPLSVLTAEAITIVDARGVALVSDASFAVGAGEIVGIAAVEGQGQHELLLAIAGRHPLAGGRLTAPVTVGFIPEDRQGDGLVLDFPLFENVALRDAGTRRGRMQWPAVRAWTHRLLAAYDVRARDEAVRAATLSGGNQQKLVLAREMGDPDPSKSARAEAGATAPGGHRPEADDRPPSTREPAMPALLVADNPTRGLDFQATGAVHDRLRQARDRGMAIVLYASDIDEVLTLADRVLVLARGEVRPVPLEREAVGRAMLGLSPEERDRASS